MTEDEERELLGRYRPWLRATAADLLTGRPPHRIADLAQEGWVAMWRALHQDRPAGPRAPLDWWLKRQAHLRMTRMIRDWFEPMKQRQHVWTDDVLTYTDLPALLPDIEMAYHHGEIYHALDALTPREREYVIQKFWLDRSTADLKEYFGYEPSGLWRTARVKLQRELMHLGGNHELVNTH